MDTNDTIIAIASPPGRSARGIIRLAGDAVPQVLNAVAQMDSTANTQTAFESLERGVHYVRLQTGAGMLPAVLLNYVAPHSYTGESAAELLLPGNPALLQRIVDEILDAAQRCELPLRPAEPGEFSARAFFHGRLSLTQAEGVAATIAARSDAQLRAAAMLRDDSIGRLASALCEQLARALALVEAGVDFTDEQDVIAITADELRQQLEDIGGRITAQLERSVGSGMLDATPRVVLTGPPNAGKSTLFNVLLGRSRAVVSDVPGTTRDVLIEPLHITTAHGDLEVLLVDIAGAERATSSLISQHMQHLADDARQRADLLLRCIANGDEVHEPLSPNELLVCTKCDLAPALEQPGEDAVHISAATGAGLDELRRGIADRLAERAVSISADAVALLPRHEAALREAGRLIDDALQLLERSTGRSVNDPELIAASMRIALDQLGLVAGRVTPDDVLGHIFAEFCIGK